MLEEQRITANCRIENADMQQSFEPEKEIRDGDDRRAENENQAGGIQRPNKERQPKPRHAWRAHFVNGDDKVQTRKNGGKARDEYAESRGNHMRLGIEAAVGRIERPPG